MKKTLSHPIARLICLYLALSLAMPLALPSATWASFISFYKSKENCNTEENSLAFKIRLENTLIAEQLSQLGLSLYETEEHLLQLSAEERTTLLQELKNIQVGGSSENDGSENTVLNIVGFTIGFIIGYSLVASSD